MARNILRSFANDHCPACAGTLDHTDLDGDGIMTVLDLDQILK